MDKQTKINFAVRQREHCYWTERRAVGTQGTETREKYEEGFETFKLGVMLQELRKEKGLTQEQLAGKCGTTKTYISRIENDASDIRLSTLMRIIREGLGGHLKLSVDL